MSNYDLPNGNLLPKKIEHFFNLSFLILLHLVAHKDDQESIEFCSTNRRLIEITRDIANTVIQLNITDCNVHFTMYNNCNFFSPFLNRANMRLFAATNLFSQDAAKTYQVE